MYGWEYFHPYLITKDMNEAKPVLWNRNFLFPDELLILHVDANYAGLLGGSSED